jgi:hypothetical protein
MGLAVTTVVASVVAVREDLPGRPLGIEVPLSVPTGILVGWGAAVAMPWPMAVAALVAAGRARRHPESVGPALVCAAVGLGGVVGILVEPNTYERGRLTPVNRAAIAAHVGASAALGLAGLRSVSRRRRRWSGVAPGGWAASGAPLASVAPSAPRGGGARRIAVRAASPR